MIVSIDKIDYTDYNLTIYFIISQVDLYNSTEESRCAISGIFIKNVIPESPAGKSGELKVRIDAKSFKILIDPVLLSNSFATLRPFSLRLVIVL